MHIIMHDTNRCIQLYVNAYLYNCTLMACIRYQLSGKIMGQLSAYLITTLYNTTMDSATVQVNPE